KVGTRRLLAAGVIQRDSEDRYAYRHAIVGQTLARDAPAELRLLVHIAAVRHYRTADALGEHRRLSQLAVHAAAAGLSEEAARSYFMLAERARAWHAYTDAERLYTCVLEQPGLLPSDRAAALRGRGLMRNRVARYHGALEDLCAARACAE